MILFLRMVWVCICGMLGRRQRVLDTSVLSMRVWPNDLDLNRHMNNGRYLSIMDLGRMDLLARTGVLRPAFRRGWFPILGSAVIRYRRSLGPMARYTLRTRIVAWDEKWFYVEQIFMQGEEVAAIAYVRGLLRSKRGNVPPQELLALTGEDVVSPPPNDVVRNWPELG